MLLALIVPYVLPTQDDYYKDYCKVIKKPMDFGLIMRRLVSVEASDRYMAISEVLKDVQLVFDNCKEYNKVRIIQISS